MLNLYSLVLIKNIDITIKDLESYICLVQRFSTMNLLNSDYFIEDKVYIFLSKN